MTEPRLAPCARCVECVEMPDGTRRHAISGGYEVSAVALIGLALTVVSTAVGVYSAYSQGQAQQKAAKYNAKVAENQATAARNAAAVREQQHRERIRQLAGTQRANSGASGIALEGSPLLVMADTLEQAELDAQRIRYGGEVSATGFESQARLQRFQGAQAAQAGMIGAGSTLLSGAAKAMSYGGGATTSSGGGTDFWAGTQTPAYQDYRRGERGY